MLPTGKAGDLFLSFFGFNYFFLFFFHRPMGFVSLPAFFFFLCKALLLTYGFYVDGTFVLLQLFFSLLRLFRVCGLPRGYDHTGL